MPNRILKESICTSEKLNQLSDFNFRIWVCLLTYVDDYGRGKAHPAIVRGSCMPLRERVTNKDVEQGLHALADIGCIRLYTVDGESYLCFPGWDKHQTIRNKKSKFPAPPDSDSEPQKIESNCIQLKSNACNCSRNPIQSNPNPKEDVVVVERAREETPFGSVEVDPLIVKVQTELNGLTDTHYNALNDYRDSLGDELVSFAIDSAVGNGSRNWSYVEAILRSYEQKHIKTIGEAKAEHEKHKQQPKQQTKLLRSQDYKQRE